VPPPAADTATQLTEVPPDAEAARCDYRACAAKYQSFDAANCTYQPYDGGPRQRCEKGAPPATATAPAVTAEAKPDAKQAGAPAPAQCNVGACSASYSSFRASDCTYQPYDGGGRRVCDKTQVSSSSAPSGTNNAAQSPRSEPGEPYRDDGDGDRDPPSDRGGPFGFLPFGN
jgi:hypothetical protein